MKRVLLLTLLGIFSISLLFSVSTDDNHKIPDGDWIITINGNPAIFASQYDIPFRIIDHNSLVGHLDHATYQRIKNDPRINSLERDITVHATAIQLPGSNLYRIGVGSATGSPRFVDIDVAVLDTGIDLNHPDLNVVRDKSFIFGGSGMDDNGHGTHVAGIIGARNNDIGVIGLAPGCRLWALKVLDRNGSGSLSGIISALHYVADRADEIELVNMSLGGVGYSPAFHAAIKRCVDAGVMVVAAAGNDGSDIYGRDRMLGTRDDVIPAAYPEVCTVSSFVDTDGMAGGFGDPYISTPLFGPAIAYRDDSLASYTNFSSVVVGDNPVTSPGKAIDLAAPGMRVRSTWLGGDYKRISGTSMASPHVVGAAARYMAEYGRALNSQGVYAVRQALIDQAEPQQAWSMNTGDTDSCREPLVSVRRFDNYWPSLAVLSSHPTGAEFGEAVTLVATALDVEDGNLSEAVTWHTIHGELGTGASISVDSLNVGSHVVMATVTDSGGKHAAQHVMVSVRPPKPAVTVEVNIDKDIYAIGELVEFSVVLKFGGVPIDNAWISARIVKNNVTADISPSSSAWTSDDGIVSFRKRMQSVDVGTNSILIVAYKYHNRILQEIVTSFEVKFEVK